MPWRVSVTLILLVAACTAQPAGSVSPPATASVSASLAGDGLTGHVAVEGGRHDGVYQLAAEAATMACLVQTDQWIVGFASPELNESITTLQLSGTSREAGAPIVDFFMSIGETTEPNTVRIGRSHGGRGTTAFRVDGNVAHVEMTGTSADGTAVSVQLTCSPIRDRL